jgi:hypothetical protein
MSEQHSDLKPKHNGSKNRRAGHNYERKCTNYFKELGFLRARTSRQASRLLDDAKVDIAYIPFNVQCKAVDSNMNYLTLIDEINVKIKELVPERKDYPTIVFHKRKNKKTLVVMNIDEFTKLLKHYDDKTRI